MRSNLRKLTPVHSLSGSFMLALWNKFRKKVCFPSEAYPTEPCTFLQNLSQFSNKNIGSHIPSKARSHQHLFWMRRSRKLSSPTTYDKFKRKRIWEFREGKNDFIPMQLLAIYFHPVVLQQSHPWHSLALTIRNWILTTFTPNTTSLITLWYTDAISMLFAWTTSKKPSKKLLQTIYTANFERSSQKKSVSNLEYSKLWKFE